MNTQTLWLIGGIAAGFITLILVMALLAKRVVRIPSDRAAIIIGRPSRIELRGADPYAAPPQPTFAPSVPTPATPARARKGDA